MFRTMKMNRFWFVVHVFIILFVINIAIIRAHVIPDSVIHNVSDGYIYSNDTVTENPLAFLDGFVFEDSAKPQLHEITHKDKKITKRSVTTSVVPQYMMDLYEYLSDKKYKVTFDTARSYRRTGKCNKLFYEGGGLIGKSFF